MSALTTWTAERVALLKDRIDAGLTCAQIALEIGVSRNAVIGKVNRLGLSRVKSLNGGPSGRTGVPKVAHPRVGAQRRMSPISTAHRQLVLPEPPLENAKRCSLLELAQGHCRWPISEPGAEDFGFCGNQQAEGLPYCAAHARMAYRPSARVKLFHRERVASTDAVDQIPYADRVAWR
jgi:GcrA cell cycle regulator